MKKLSTSDIAKMPIEGPIQFVEDIWDSIAESPEAVTVPEWHKDELEKRLDTYHATPREQTIKLAHMQTLVTKGVESGAGKQTMEELREKARKEAGRK